MAPISREQISIVIASPQQIVTVQHLWGEYWKTLGLPADFQGFQEERMDLPGKYGLPQGRLLLALVQGDAAGTMALRPLDQFRCEAKRLYVRPRYRGYGVGATLLSRLVEEASLAGYEEMYCDTLPSMQPALQLYLRFGFVEVGPYSSDPTPGATFLKLVIHREV